MHYIAQKDTYGCFRASVAMVLDMTYEEVAKIIPMQSETQIAKTGYLVLDLLTELAKSKGFDLNDAKECKLGFRYLLASWDGVSTIGHTFAVDEFGIASDPLNAFSFKRWSDIPNAWLLEFRRCNSSHLSESK